MELGLICPVCRQRRQMSDIREEAMRRYKQRFGESYITTVARNSSAAIANYAPIYSEVQSQWRSLGCEALQGGTHVGDREVHQR